MRLVAGILLLFVCLAQIQSAFADDATCHQFVDVMLKSASEALHDQNTTYQRKHEKLSALFQEAVDIPWVAQHVAGQYWAGASDQQREDYVKVYRNFLSDYYIGGLDEGDMNQIQTIALHDFAPAEPSGYEAQVQLAQKDDDTIMIYLRLAQDPSGTCHVHDFTVEGVSLLVSQSDEIGSLGASGGLTYITQQLAAHPAHQGINTASSQH